MSDLFNNFDQNLYKLGVPLYKGDGNPLSDTSSITPSSIGDGFSHGSTEMVNNNLQSGKFVTGVSGWRIDADGNAEFNNGTFRGTFILGGSLITVSDIADLQPAIDALELLGGGTASLVPDTYTATSSFTVPSRVTVDGNGSTIDFGGGAFQFLVQGTNAYSTGTVTATFGNPNIVGVGTTWTASMVGRSILIGDYWYVISARIDNTHITLSSNFIGTNVAGDTYVIATTVDGAVLKNINLQNASGTLLKFKYCNGLSVSTCNFYTAGQGIDGSDSGTFFLNENSNIDTCTVGLTLNNVPFCAFDLMGVFNISGGTALDLTRVSNTALSTFSIQNVTGVAMKFTNCYDIGVINYAFIQVTSHGIEFASGNRDINASEGYIDTCGGDGIKLTATSDTIQLFGNSLLNCTGYGINIAAASCDNTNIGLNTFTNNTAGKINDSGTGTVIYGDDTAYGASWNGNLGTPTKNAVYDKIETLGGNTLVTLTASEDLTIGQMVGSDNITASQTARAKRTNSTAAHGLTVQTFTNNKYFCPIGGAKFVFFTNNGATLSAQVGTISKTTNTITLGTAVTISTSYDGNFQPSICKLDTDKFCVFYLNTASTTALKYRAATVSGTVITFGTEAAIATAGSTAQGGFSSADFISTDKCVFVYNLPTATNGRMIVATFSGTVATWGTATAMGTNTDDNVGAMMVKTIATDKFVVCTYRTTASLYAQVCTCTGTTTITAGSEVQISTTESSNGTAAFMAVVAPATDVFVVRGASFFTACTVSTRTPTAGATLSTTMSNSAPGGLYAVSATTLYANAQSNNNGTISKITLSGTTLTDGGIVVQPYTSSTFVTTAGMVPIDNGYFVAIGIDTTNINAYIQGMSNNFIGVAQATVSSGQSVSVLVAGIDANQTNLAPGASYLVNTGGSLLFVSNIVLVNTLDDIDVVKAISATQVIV